MNPIEKCIEQESYGDCYNCELCKAFKKQRETAIHECEQCPCYTIMKIHKPKTRYCPCGEVAIMAAKIFSMPFMFTNSLCGYGDHWRYPYIIRPLLIEMNKRIKWVEEE